MEKSPFELFLHLYTHHLQAWSESKLLQKHLVAFVVVVLSTLDTILPTYSNLTTMYEFFFPPHHPFLPPFLATDFAFFLLLRGVLREVRMRKPYDTSLRGGGDPKALNAVMLDEQIRYLLNDGWLE